MNADYFIEQIADIRQEVAAVKRDRLTYRDATVISVDTTLATFEADVTGVGAIAGIESPPDMLPAVGDLVRLSLTGSVPRYDYGRQMTTTDPALGQQTSNVTPAGVYSVKRIESADDPVFQGVPLSESLEGIRSGLVGFGRISQSAVTGIGTAEFGTVEVAFTPKPGHAYAVHVGGLNISGTVAHDDVWLTVRATTNGTKPTSASTALAGPIFDNIPAASRYKTFGFYTFLMGLSATAGAQPMHRLLLTVARGAGGTGTIDLVACEPTILVLDIGPNVPNTGVINTGTVGSTTAVQNFDVTYDAAWSQTYDGSGNPYHRFDPEIAQGFSSSLSSVGNMRSIVGFPSLTTALAGATITKVEISFYTNETGLSTGIASIGHHGNTSAPATFNGTPNQFVWSNWGRNQRKTIDVTSWASSLQSGAIRGFVVGPAPTTAADYYMWWNGAGMVEPPRIRVVYSK